MAARPQAGRRRLLARDCGPTLRLLLAHELKRLFDADPASATGDPRAAWDAFRRLILTPVHRVHPSLTLGEILVAADRLEFSVAVATLHFTRRVSFVDAEEDYVGFTAATLTLEYEPDDRWLLATREAALDGLGVSDPADCDLIAREGELPWREWLDRVEGSPGFRLGMERTPIASYCLDGSDF